MHGGRIPDGEAPMVQATEKGMLTKQSTLAGGFPPKVKDSRNWMSLMDLKASRQATST